MMGILSAHALVGTGGSGKTKAGFELGGRPLGLAALSLSLTIPSNASAASLLHTSHFRHSVFTLAFRGTAHPTPWFLSARCLSFTLILYPNPHHLKGTYLLSQLIFVDLPGRGRSKERMKEEGGETAPPPIMDLGSSAPR